MADERTIRAVIFDMDGVLTDSEPLVTRFPLRERHRQIVLAGFRSAGPCVQDGVGRQFVREIIAIHNVNPLRQTGAEWMAGHWIGTAD